MASLLQRLFATQAPIVKAETGPGVISLLSYPSLTSLSNRPEKLIAECEALFHTNPWVAAAERAIGRAASVEYHLEDEDDETVDEDTSDVAAALIHLLDHPSKSRSRRQLWSLTMRHMGLTGNAFWYLSERELLGGTPLETLYINPARMTSVENGQGELLGWIMDHPQNPVTRGGSPTPFELDEIIHFTLDEPDFGHYGIGIAESAQSKIDLSRLTDRHAAFTVGSGGRLAGMISPKTGVTIGDDGWQAIVRDYRTIVNDPDSAKRLQVIRQPMDFTETSANPSDMQLHDLMIGSRDDILALWGVPLSQLGIAGPAGLNSGDKTKFDEAALWQGPIDARLDPFSEKVQGLIDRFAPLGLVARIEFETPAFDDQAPLFENASKAKALPLTNDERRALIGLDPLADKALGKVVYIEQTMVPLNGGVLVPITPPPPAKASPLTTLRHRMEVTWEPRIRKVVLGALSAQRDELASRIEAKHSHLSRKPSDTAVWWNSERERRRLTEALEPLVLTLAREVANRASDKFPGKAMDAGYLEALTTFIRQRVGERITAISETTRDDIARVVEQGISSGLSPVELGAAIRDATAFGEARAELISRTETMFAYNDAALRTYTELGAERVQAIDGDQDDECAARDGREFTVDEAYSITDHPNGTLDWIPIVPAKAAPLPEPPQLHLHLPDSVVGRLEMAAPEVTVNVAAAEPADVTVNVPKQDAPVVNVTVPEQPAPIVNVEQPAKATSPQEVIVTAMPPREHRVIRKGGEVTGSVETDV